MPHRKQSVRCVLIEHFDQIKQEKATIQLDKETKRATKPPSVSAVLREGEKQLCNGIKTHNPSPTGCVRRWLGSGAPHPPTALLFHPTRGCKGIFWANTHVQQLPICRPFNDSIKMYHLPAPNRDKSGLAGQ